MRGKEGKMGNRMPVSVFAKLCADECKQLRKRVSEQNSIIAQQEGEINRLRQMVERAKDADFVAAKEVREQTMYRTLRQQNKRLRKENSNLKKKYSEIFTRMMQEKKGGGDD